MYWFRVISVDEIKNNKIYHHVTGDDLGHFSGVQSKMNNELIII